MPNYSSDQAQSSQDNHVKEIEEDSPLEEPEKQTLLGRSETNHQGHKVEGQGR